MSYKKRVLIFIDWFYPAYKAGGPIKSVFNIVESLKTEISFLIITSNIDVDGEFLDVVPNEIIQRENYQVIYLNLENQRKNRYLELFNTFKPNTIYYNSIFSKNFTIRPLLLFRKFKVQQIIAPRGMLGEGALAIKPLKKKLFLQAAKTILRNNKNIQWHASTELEKVEIQSIFGKKPQVNIAQNLSAAPSNRTSQKDSKSSGELKMIFISRITTKKNLLYILDLMQNLRELDQLSLSIYGPIEDDNYWQKCLTIISADQRIIYGGILKPDTINTKLQNAHLFILPTLHENYGHVIAESINAGVPVLISDKTPWQNLKDENIGFDIPLESKKEWESALEYILHMKAEDYDKMIQSCYEYSLKNIVSTEIVEQNRRLFGL